MFQDMQGSELCSKIRTNPATQDIMFILMADRGAQTGKSGRLVLSLKTGKGAILFDSGRVVHAEFAGKTGEEAFRALVVASHREQGGSFSFVPVDAGEASRLPNTIQTDLETLLLNIAVAMDEKQRDTRN